MSSRLMSAPLAAAPGVNATIRRLNRAVSMETFPVRVFTGSVGGTIEVINVDAAKNTTTDEVIESVVQKLRLGRGLGPGQYQLVETFSSGGQVCKERRLEAGEYPVKIQLLWPRTPTLPAGDIHRTEYGFFLRPREASKKVGQWEECATQSPMDSVLSAFLQQPRNREYPDLCNLPDLNETTLMDNLRSRFTNGNIYTYIGSILISVNPFKFYPIYNPKYVRMYQNRRLGDLPPHIFAIADAAYHKMLADKTNQCIVISGESGSGKTESTNLLLHHLSALSQRGSAYGAATGGIEQTILGAGPVLEAFGNAKTVHNNNSSRFGKFIQVNYKENGMVHGALVEKYLLEKSRIVSQAENERNYHVFYYLLAGAGAAEKQAHRLGAPEDYFYLNQSQCFTLEGIDGEFIDEAHEFTRLRQSMDIVGFSSDMQKRIFTVLAAVLHLGNIEFKKRKEHSHHEVVQILNPETVELIADLLRVKAATLFDALTKRKTQAGGETVVINFKLDDAIATRDAMAKCLYGALFDWIVLQVNHALISKREYQEHKGNSIGVLDIFGFEDFAKNSFEQFCINYANEHLQYYFNQHIFKFEQEEYVKEGIVWKNIDFIDNTGCLHLFSRRPTGLLSLLDEECNFPGATDESLLNKYHTQHKNNEYYEVPQMREDAFCVIHYAGKVKYQINDFRMKNSDLMRHDIMMVLKNSKLSFVRELVGYDPVAVLRWSILRAFFRAYFAFIAAGRRYRQRNGERYGSAIRKTSQLSRAQHLAMATDSSGGEQPARRVSYGGGICSNGMMYDNSDDEEDEGVEDDGDEDDDEFFYDDERCSSLGLSQTEESPPSVDSLQLGNPRGRSRHSWGPDNVQLGATDAKVMRRASKVIMKNKSFRPRTRTTKQLRDLKAMKTLAGKTPVGPRSSGKGKNKPPSVSQQFNYSLSRLMDTLNKANPFFVRCIKSNAQKLPCVFDNDNVLRQLRYTGMLATVKIRQSGYNYRLPFEDFITQYKILLPRGLVSSRHDIEHFLHGLDLNSENYQIGKTKVFLREAEKMLLDEALHHAIMQRIVTIQRWVKARLTQRRYVAMKHASVVIQTAVRSYLAQKHYSEMRLRLYACIMIQKCFRGFRIRKQLERKEAAATRIQALCRGYMARKRVAVLKRAVMEQQAEYTKLLRMLMDWLDEANREREELEREEDNRRRLEQELSQQRHEEMAEICEITHDNSVTMDMSRKQSQERKNSGLNRGDNSVVPATTDMSRKQRMASLKRAKKEERERCEWEKEFKYWLEKAQRMAKRQEDNRRRCEQEEAEGVGPLSRQCREEMAELSKLVHDLPPITAETSVGRVPGLAVAPFAHGNVPSCSDEGLAQHEEEEEVLDESRKSPETIVKEPHDHNESAPVNGHVTPQQEIVPEIVPPVASSQPTRRILPQRSAPVSKKHIEDFRLSPLPQKDSTASPLTDIDINKLNLEQRKSGISKQISLDTPNNQKNRDTVDSGRENLDKSADDSQIAQKNLLSVTVDTSRTKSLSDISVGNTTQMTDSHDGCEMSKAQSGLELRQHRHYSELYRDSRGSVISNVDIDIPAPEFTGYSDDDDNNNDNDEPTDLKDISRSSSDAADKKKREASPVLYPLKPVKITPEQRRRPERPKFTLDTDPAADPLRPTVPPKGARPGAVRGRRVPLPRFSEIDRKEILQRAGDDISTTSSSDVTTISSTMTTTGSASSLCDDVIVRTGAGALDTMGDYNNTSPWAVKARAPGRPIRDSHDRFHSASAITQSTPKASASPDPASVATTTTGSRDVEIRIHPAIMAKSQSEQCLGSAASVAISRYPSTAKVRRYHHHRATALGAPLAHTEELTEDSDDFADAAVNADPAAGQPAVEVRHVMLRAASLDEDTVVVHSAENDEEEALPGSGDRQHSHSPFSRVNKVKAKLQNIMGGNKNKLKKSQGDDDDSDESPVEDEVKSPKSPSQKKAAPQWDNSTKNLRKRRMSKKQRRKTLRENRGGAGGDEGVGNTWNVKGKSQWQYPSHQLVRNTAEFQHLQNFVREKILLLEKDTGRRDTIFDKVFKGALNDLHTNLITQLGLALQENRAEFKYCDLMVTFEKALSAAVARETTDAESFPDTIGINAFRGYMDEFDKKRKSGDLPTLAGHKKEKKEKKKKEKDKEIFECFGHKYQSVQFSIPTYCELCASIIWMVEKGFVCQCCKYTVHKKCSSKSDLKCKGSANLNNAANKGERGVFGVPLFCLVEDGRKVPVFCERLITAIELDGLYTVGIYRKAGAAGRIKQLIADLNADVDGVNLAEYQIHVLTSTLKTFLRELPDPLMTFELYDDFMRAGEIKDDKERLQAVYAAVDKLPDIHHNLLERLIYHLARVAQHESANKMSAQGLAIIFAPSILRTNINLPAQESLNHVPKQTLCVESIITEQMRKIRLTLADIKTLEAATLTASDRLSTIRASKRGGGAVKSDGEASVCEVPTTPPIAEEQEQEPPAAAATAAEEGEQQQKEEEEEEEMLLAEQIQSLQQEKEELTLGLPRLEFGRGLSSSEEDLLSTDNDLDSVDDLDDDYALTFEYPAMTPPKNLTHLTKRRANTPTRRPPTKRKMAAIKASTNRHQDDDEWRSPPTSEAGLMQVGDEVHV